MLTIFSTPRPFHGHFDIIQRNAIESWLQLNPRPQIILVDDEEGTTKKIAAEYGLECISGISQNKYGTLFLDEVFSRSIGKATGRVLAHVNTDIILFQDFIDRISDIKDSLFYLCGRRFNLDVKSRVDFSKQESSSEVRRAAEQKNDLHAPTGMDYWVFPKVMALPMPRFLVGRPAVDNWFIQQARKNGIRTIDGTSSILIIHQNHDRGRNSSDQYQEESEWNRRLSKGEGYYPGMPLHYFTSVDAEWTFASPGLIRKKRPFLWNFRYRHDLEVIKSNQFFWIPFLKSYNLLRGFASRLKHGRKRQ